MSGNHVTMALQLPGAPGPAQPTVSAATEAVIDWLLEGPAQLSAGPERGAVLGGTGYPRYAYPEITGYYLQWLAWRDACHDRPRVALRERASCAHDWLCRWAAQRPALTRVYLDGAPQDWRNDLVFAFDLAMVLRGLGSAASRGLLKVEASLVRSVCADLELLIREDGQLAACSPEPALIQRWSTRQGPFLAKAAAGILSAATVMTIPETLQKAARLTSIASVQALRTRPHLEAHPQLYAIEGALSTHPWLAGEATARSLHEIEAQLMAGSSSGDWRSDVCAQYVRAALLLPEARAGSSLEFARELVECIGKDGSVPFSVATDTQANVWCAIFTEQALAVLRTPALAPLLARYLV